MHTAARRLAGNNRSNGKKGTSMSIPAMSLPENQRWTELVELIDFISVQLERVGNGKEDIRIRLVPGKHTEEGSETKDDWFEGYLAALGDVVVFIERRHSARLAA
jgi:hypothetical protein